MGVIEWLGMIFYGLWGWIAVLIGACTESCQNMREMDRKEGLACLKTDVVDDDNMILSEIYKRDFEDPSFHDQLLSEYLDVLSEIPLDTTWLEQNGFSHNYCYSVYLAKHYGMLPHSSWMCIIGGKDLPHHHDEYKLYKWFDKTINSFHPGVYMIFVDSDYGYCHNYKYDWNFNSYSKNYKRVKDMQYGEMIKPT